MIKTLVFLVAFFPQDSKPPEFVKFEVARERVGHKVAIDAGLRNPGAAEVVNLKLTVLYFEGDREVRRSKPVTVARIPPGETSTFRIEADQVPNFTRYEIYLETGSVTRLYLGTDAASLPALKPAGRAGLVVVSHRLSPLTVVVRNSGATPADEPTVALTFRNGASAVVFQTRARLEKAIAPLSEDTFEISVPGVPPHASVDAAVAWQASDELVLPDVRGGAKDVVLRQCRAVRLTDGAARVSGVFANGTGGAVRRVAAKFRLGRCEASYELPGALKAGASRPFVFHVPSCPPFDAVSFDLSFDEAGAAEADAEAPPAPSARRTATRRAEGDAVKLPPPPAKTAEDAAAAEVRLPSVGMRGLLVSEGSFGKNGKYSGDIYFMKMIFLDGKGKPFQPEATVQFVLYDGEKQVRKAQRTITKEGWKVDAGRLKGADLELDTIALDRKTNELWVGIHWTDKAFVKPRADITVEIPNVGAYLFKNVEKDWVAAPRYPDVK